MIVVERLTKRYSAAPPVLRGLSFAIDAGQTTAVLGKSGVGKSTLLRCLAGLEAFDSGTIAVGDVTVSGNQGARLRGVVGVVFQSLELFPHLSILDNCALAPTVVAGRARAEVRDEARALLASLDVVDCADAFPEALSGGQRQRAAIVRALMMKPRVLLYDEPTSALDPSLKAEVGRAIKDVAARTGMTQLIVTHDPAWAEAHCDDVFTLDESGLTKTIDR